MQSLAEAAMEAGQPVDTMPNERPHILICTPCHSGKVDVNYSVSLALAGGHLSKNGVNYTLDYNVGMTVDGARSEMATRFWKGKEYTHMLFIDDDMAFSADLPYRMLIENVGLVAVPYRRKQRVPKYNIRHPLRVKYMPDRPYMMAVENIATGMMMIRRDLIEKLAPTTPDYLYNDQGEGGKLFFRHDLVDDEMVGGVAYMGEDYFFCKKAREAGFDVWAYVDENVAHIGNYAYDGAYSDFCERDTGKKYSTDRPKLPMRMLLR